LFFFQQGRLFASRKPAATSTFEKAELAAGQPLSKEEKEELERRRRASELEGVELSSPVEVEGQSRERWELEARRRQEEGRIELG